MRKYHFLYLLVSLCFSRLEAADIDWQLRIQEAAEYAKVSEVPPHEQAEESKQFILLCLSEVFTDFVNAQCVGIKEVGSDEAPNPKYERAVAKYRELALKTFLRGGLIDLQQAIDAAKQEAVKRQLNRLEDLTV